MKNIGFSVGAKAARLIGRENIADVDGALMELIKNSYDADASCVLVRYQIPFLEVPKDVDIGKFREILSDKDFLTVISFYEDREGKLQKKVLTDEESVFLEDLLTSYNRIIVADNGSGMDYDTVTSSWMYIGTSDKEQNYTSVKGRIKTGAKGIGRFAIDKLSRRSNMYTKEQNSEKMVFWSMDWNQFANAKLISDVKANLDEINGSYDELVRSFFVEDEEVWKEHDWTHGTLIELSPAREFWNRRLFKKVNTNLRSINPIGTVDKFDVIITNDFYPDCNFKTEKVAIGEADYDYRIKINYDGDDELKVILKRNEVNLSVKKVPFEVLDVVKEISVEDFWNRDAFKRNNYRREDYKSEIEINHSVKTILPNDSIEKIKKVGSFTAEMYFMRLDSTDKYPIIKSVSRKSRKDLTDKFSGIKIYRDSFKVRPYGDEGSLFDWLELGTRVQKSPAGVANKESPWRVQPYQILGWVSIGRKNNPFLEDMANREALALNEYFYIFKDLLVAGIEEFEFDRQFIYREYAKWKEEVEAELSGELNNSAKIIEKARKKNAENAKRKNNEQSTSEEYDEQEFSGKDLFGTVQELVEEKDRQINERQIMQILSSSGIVINTFFHEFNAINTQFHVEAPQLRSRIKYLLKNQEYEGLPAYNPYSRIDSLEKNDKLTAAFLDVVMEGLKKDNLRIADIRLSEALKLIIEQWVILLSEKNIHVEYSYDIDEEENDKWSLSKVDLYIILNNFMLNSAWFLEDEHNSNREVTCELKVRKKLFELLLRNNGPALDEKYRYNPAKIFELGETTKNKKMIDGRRSEGTGLGLWILKETVERNKGAVEVVEDNNGFSLRIVINR